VSSKYDGDKGIYIIKRSTFSNYITEGGLNITDVECFNKPLKPRKFDVAHRYKHPITLIKGYCMEQMG
jgi:hypothetical protein